MKFMITLLTGLLVSSFAQASMHTESSSSKSSISSEDTNTTFSRKKSLPPRK